MIIDVRDDVDTVVDTIVFADGSDSYINAVRLDKGSSESILRIYDEEDDFVCITSKEHAENLIKALQKAIEFRWVE